MFNMSDDMLPKQKEYPEFTFEVSHKRRRCWFIKAESQEEKDKWVKHFKNACYWARSVKEEWVGRQAFDRAIWRTRWRLGRYGWWSYGSVALFFLQHDLQIIYIAARRSRCCRK